MKIFDLWKRTSPYIKEWLFACFQYSLVVGGGSFLVYAFGRVFWGGNPNETWIEGILLFCVQFPIGISFIVTLLMPLPRKELLDKIMHYPTVKMKMSIGSIDSFRTSFEVDRTSQPVTNINCFVAKSYCFPLRICCNDLKKQKEPKSSLKQKNLLFATLEDSFDEIEDLDDLFITNDMKFTTDQITEYCYKLHLLLDYETLDVLDDLITLEPTMEFQISYLRHSHLIVKMEPIEGYTYEGNAIDLLNKINQKIIPWINKDSLRCLSEKQVSKIQNRMDLKMKLTRPDIKEAEKKKNEELDIDRILDEYRKKKYNEKSK